MTEHDEPKYVFPPGAIRINRQSALPPIDKAPFVGDFDEFIRQRLPGEGSMAQRIRQLGGGDDRQRKLKELFLLWQQLQPYFTRDDNSA